MIKDYKVTGKLIPGAVYIRYEKGLLATVAFEINEPLNVQVFEALKARLKQEENLKLMAEGFEVKELGQGKSIQEKIVMFNSSYKFHRGVPYKPKEVEKANLKNVPVTRELLETFFKSPLANYTLDNYIKRINITRDFLKNGMNNHLASAFPDEWDEEFSRTLDGPRLSAYYKHLVESGWKKDETGVWRKILLASLITFFLVGCGCEDTPYYESLKASEVKAYNEYKRAVAEYMKRKGDEPDFDTVFYDFELATANLALVRKHIEELKKNSKCL